MPSLWLNAFCFTGGINAREVTTIIENGMKAGLLFGSFNPVHIGHLAIANYMVEFTDIEEVWFIVSLRNPLKKKKTLLDNYHRLELVNRAIDGNDKFRASSIEFNLPQPSYTIDTLVYLKEKYPGYDFVLIMGEDNVPTLDKWKNYKEILNNYEIYVYPRPGTYTSGFDNHKNIKKVDAPLMGISASFIRNTIKKKKNPRYFLPDKVYQYILEMHFYEK